MLNSKGLAGVAIILIVAIVSAIVVLTDKNTKQTKIAQEASVSAIPTLTPLPTPKPTPALTPSPSPIPTAAPTQAATSAPAVTTNNTPPGAGFSRQTVFAEGQNYPVAIVAADLNSTKVIVDTASESDCSNDCSVLPLADYVSRNGAFAGINGSFFCPSEYPNCAGKTNSFDTLLMNKNKHYFNSDNNVYSNVPAAIFTQGSARFVSRSLEWGRDTGVDSVIANYPLLIAGSNINYTENPSEPKFGQKGPRAFIASKGNMVYIGVISNATMGESAKVLKALSMDEALNLDEGGSTALWSGGYIFGPGRNIPNAVLFVKR